MGESGGGRPPTITFGWGQTVSFKAVARQLTIRYTLFRPDGSPIRALAHLSLMQAEKAQDGSSTPGRHSGWGQPDHARHRRDQLARRPRGRQPAVDRVRRLRRPDAVAHDRRGERDRRPAAPAARPRPRDSEARSHEPRVDTGVMLALVEVKIGRHPGPGGADPGGPRPGQHCAPRRVQHHVRAARPRPRASIRWPSKASTEHRSDGRGVPRRQPRDTQKQKLFEARSPRSSRTFGPEGIRLVASGYDRSHRLHRDRKTRTFQGMTSVRDRPEGLVRGRGLSSTRRQRPSEKHEFFQQNNETDFEFIKRLASMLEYEVVMVDGGCSASSGSRSGADADRARVRRELDERRPSGCIPSIRARPPPSR